MDRAMGVGGQSRAAEASTIVASGSAGGYVARNANTLHYPVGGNPVNSGLRPS
jgi:hypothetical protein